MPIRIDNQGDGGSSPVTSESALLMETGEILLLETGDYILLDGAGDFVLIDQSTPQDLIGQFRFPQSRIGSSTDYSLFDATGHQTMAGEARPWRDQLTDAINLKSSGVGVSVNPTESTVDFVYNAATSDYIFTNIQLNHDKDLSCAIYPHIHWFQEKAYVPNFLLQYRWQTIGGLKVTGWTDLACNSLAFAYGGFSMHQISYSAHIDVPVGSSISDIVQFRIVRDTGNTSGKFAGADPYNTGGNATASVLAYDVHFQINSLGSTDEYVK